MDAQIVPDITHSIDLAGVATSNSSDLAGVATSNSSDLAGVATSNSSDLAGGNVDEDVPDLDIAGAVKEILQVILAGTTDPAVQLHLSVKATTTKSMCNPRTWFYIKVVTSCAVRKEMFSVCSTSSTPALYHCLRAMQALEEESHLCIQHRLGGQGQVEQQGQRSNVGQEVSEDRRSVQQNLVLKGDNLEVLHEVQKRKSSSESTLYLRVHQQLLHMLGQSSELHKFLCQVKIFKPQSDLSFTVKLGAVSHTSFSVHHWRKISPQLPCLVTDSEFLLHDSGLLPLQPVSSPYCCEPISMSSIGRGLATPRKMMEVHTVGQCVLVRGQGSGSPGIITLTLFGPDYLPLDIGPDGATSMRSLLDDIDWEMFHLKQCGPDRSDIHGQLPCHFMTTVRSTGEHAIMDSFVASLFLICQASDQSNSDTQYITGHACKILGNHRSACVRRMGEALNKVLQPVLVAMKNRRVVQRSVRSVCKAMVDVMTLSDNDQFRSALLSSLQVEDTVDLGSSLRVKLLSISKSHHSALWREHDPTGEHDPAQGTRTAKESNEVIPGQVWSLYNTVSQGTQPAQGNDTVIPGQVQALSCNTVSIPSVTRSLPSPSNTVSQALGERSQLVSQASRERSPFQQLAESDIVHYDSRDKSKVNNNSLDEANGNAERMLNEGEEVRSNDDFNDLSDTRNDLNDLSDTRNESSDFTDLLETRDEVHTSPDVTDVVENDTTPDISRITEAMKDISPFQEFADTDKPDKKRDLDCISEDPYACKKIRRQHEGGSDSGMIGICGGDTEERYRTAMFRNLNTRNSSGSELQSLAPVKPVIPTVPDSSQVLQGPSDEEILKSKDWDSTFEVVSSFIDKISAGGDLTEEVIAECSSAVTGSAVVGSAVVGVGRNDNKRDTGSVSNKRDMGSVREASVDGDVNTRVDDSEDWFDKVLLDVENWLS